MHKEWLFSYKTINSCELRHYDNNIIDIEYVFLSEYRIFLINMFNLNLKIFYIETIPNHNLILKDSDFNFLNKCYGDKNFRKNHFAKVKGYEMPQTTKILREYQSFDLMPFYDDLIAESLFVISKMTDNLYHFNMVVCVKSELELQNYLKKKFKTVCIKNISNILIEDLTYSFMNSVFNFKELEIFQKTRVYDIDYHDYKYKFYDIDFIEKINFENYKKYCFNNNIDFSNNPIYNWYKFELEGKISEMEDHRFIFQNEAKIFGWSWFVLEYNFLDEIVLFGKIDYSYPAGECFVYTAHEFDIKPMAIVKSDGSQLPIPDYEFGGMFDIIENVNDWDLPFNFNTIYVQWKIYKTIYKQRLLSKNINEK